MQIRTKYKIIIAQAFWGQHLGREATQLLIDVAYRELEASLLIAIVHPENEASLRLVKFLDFAHVGTRQSHRWDNGHQIFERKSPRCA